MARRVKNTRAALLRWSQVKSGISGHVILAPMVIERALRQQRDEARRHVGYAAGKQAGDMARDERPATGENKRKIGDNASRDC